MYTRAARAQVEIPRSRERVPSKEGSSGRVFGRGRHEPEDHDAGLPASARGGRAALDLTDGCAASVRRLHVNAQVRMLDLLALDEFGDDRGDRAGRDGEAHTFVSARVALDLRVDADDLAGH